MNTTLCNPAVNAANPNTSRVQYRRPVYQVINLEGGFDIRLEVPGCTREGIRIHHEKDTLTIEASRDVVPSQSWKLLHREIPDADFRLKLNLNVNINSDGITARTEDGVLTIHLPLADEAKPRLISID
jgi:HSP20 family protein